MTPDQFSSFAFGFNLRSTAYSGGAAGTFTNLKAGGENWAVAAATPSFETRQGMEGMLFANSADESILGQMRALYEATIIVVAEADVTDQVFPFGGTLAANWTYGISMVSKNSTQVYTPNLPSGYASYVAGRPRVITASFSPFEGKVYIQADAGSPVSATSVTVTNACISYANAAIGRHRTTYFTGWIGRVLVFSRALHYRENTNLQALILTEMAGVGL